MFTPFLRIRPWNFARVSCVWCAPALPFTNWFLLLFSLEVWDPWRPIHPQGHIKYVCNFSGSISQKRRGHLDFVRRRVYQVFDFGCWIWVNIGSTQSVQSESVLRMFARKKCTKMSWSTWKRLVQKRNGLFFLPTLDAWLLLTFFGGMRLFGTRFWR